MRYMVGVDEVGRGPLAGPVAVGALLIRPEHRRFLRGVKDSKKLDEKMREYWYRKIKELEKQGSLAYKVAFVSERTIDGKGLSYALMRAVGSCLRRLGARSQTRVFLDGSLYAPEEYVAQSTIIRGDERNVVIAAASIMAKVRRDRRMKALSKKFPQYGFDKHRGYGTKEHYEALKKHGPCAVHRRSFLTTWRKK